MGALVFCSLPGREYEVKVLLCCQSVGWKTNAIRNVAMNGMHLRKEIDSRSVRTSIQLNSTFSISRTGGCCLAVLFMLLRANGFLLVPLIWFIFFPLFHPMLCGTKIKTNADHSWTTAMRQKEEERQRWTTQRKTCFRLFRYLLPAKHRPFCYYQRAYTSYPADNVRDELQPWSLMNILSKRRGQPKETQKEACYYCNCCMYIISNTVIVSMSRISRTNHIRTGET